MRRAKSIDELYEEVKGYDIVLTNDAALVTALNAKIDTPRIGGFAYTPRHIAKNEAVPIFGDGALDDLQIIAGIAKETGYSLKQIHSELENIRTIRRYKKDVRRYLYSEPSRKIYRSFQGLRTIEKLMDSYVPEDTRFFEGKKVAVIGIELFDDLDKHFVPIDHDEIDVFTDGRYDIDIIYEVGNDRQLAENAVSLIEKEKDNDTAIVLDTTGPIADAVRAALYRRGIRFKNTMSVKDLPQVRDYLQFLSLSLSYETLRVRHVRELLSGYRGELRQREDEYLLHKIEGHLSGRTKMLVETMKNIRDLTFQEVCDRVVGDAHRPQIKMVIEDMEIENLKVASKPVNELGYAVNNIDDLRHNEEIPENEKKGVLLADCSRSMYVDRPFVIYLGLGPEWSNVTIGKEYIDKESEAERNMFRFSVLLQQGVTRVYAVNSMKNGKRSSPSPVFEQIKEYERREEESAAVSGFEDVADKVIKGQWTAPAKVETVKRGDDVFDIADKEGWSFSKSTYNNYYACPRAYMYGKMIHIPDSEKTIFGSIIHEFAEFYLCYPELVREDPDAYTEMIRDRYSGLSSQQMTGIDWSRIRICMANIIRFIDSLGIKEVPLDRDNSERKYKNTFMEMHNCTKYSSITETEFDTHKHPLFGNFDLIVRNRVIDYKTGKSNTAKEVKERMDMGKKQDYFEFQPLVYLSLLRDNSPPPHRFSLVYVADNDVRSVTDEDFRISENVRDVVLVESSMREFLSDPDSPVKSIYSADGYKRIVENWSAFVNMVYDSGIVPSLWKGNEDLAASVAGAFGMSTKKGMENSVRAIGWLSEIVISGMYEEGTEVIVPMDTLERFLSKVDEDHTTASKQTYTEFPASPRVDCSKCSFFKACTKDKIELEGGEEDQ